MHQKIADARFRLMGTGFFVRFRGNEREGGTMIKHVVCWKLYDQALGGNRETNARLIRERLKALDEALPMMQSVEIGINSGKAPGENYDVALICVFEGFQALHDYKNHPEHKAFVEFVTPLSEDVVNVDFQMS